MAEHRMKTSGYLASAFDVKARNAIVRGIVKELKKKSADFDAIAVRGVSGLMIGSIVSDKLKKPMIVVRKNEENSHASYAVEGPTQCRYVIIDDLIASGHTIRTIIEDIHKSCPDSGLVGIALYHPLTHVDAGNHHDDFMGMPFIVYQHRISWDKAGKWLTYD